MAENALTVLGIETSCDETAAAVVSRQADGAGEILSNIVASQFDAHAVYGGVVPEIAARAHVIVVDRIIRQAMDTADMSWSGLSAIAVTAGPGLIGGLLVGTVTAQAIASAHRLPLVGINHLEGHALTARLTDRTTCPFLLLLVSGGHTQILAVEGIGHYRRLGSTIDDALGETFDKTAKILGLGFPGGPAVEAAARFGNPDRFDLPRPLLKEPGCNFSFSGLKTAVRYRAQASKPLDDQAVADLCASFQVAVCDILADRMDNALAMLDHAEGATASRTPDRTLVVSGGVAANRAIRERLEDLCIARGLRFVAPPPALCGDNGAMIAWAAAERLAAGLVSDADPSHPLRARARWPLDEAAPALIGSGRLGARV